MKDKTIGNTSMLSLIGIGSYLADSPHSETLLLMYILFRIIEGILRFWSLVHMLL